MKDWGDTLKRLEKFKKYSAKTLAIHGGQSADPITGSVMAPIYQTSTYAQSDFAKPLGEFEYSRCQNPSRRILEDALALIEGGNFGLATSSGMGAISLVMSFLSAGDEIICGDDVYGGTYRYLSQVLSRYKIKAHFVDFSKIEEDENFLDQFDFNKVKMIWLETPTNPLLKIFDIEKITQYAKKKKCLVSVDNTFATPIFQNPLALGADFVVHSLTKYVGGHSDTVAGAVIVKDEDLAEKLYFEQKNVGPICPPFDSWLLTRSLKTLAVRMRAHEENAQKVAEYLEKSPHVEKVVYPGLENHPQHALAKKQMHGFGGMLSFYIKGDLEKTKAFVKNLKLVLLAESLGGVESLIEHPATMTHASIPKELREENGISDNLLRLSVGIESLDDILQDFEDALKPL